MLYKFLSGLAKGVTHCIFRVKVVGKENVPKDGGMILALSLIHISEPTRP